MHNLVILQPLDFPNINTFWPKLQLLQSNGYMLQARYVQTQNCQWQKMAQSPSGKSTGGCRWDVIRPYEVLNRRQQQLHLQWHHDIQEKLWLIIWTSAIFHFGVPERQFSTKIPNWHTQMVSNLYRVIKPTANSVGRKSFGNRVVSSSSLTHHIYIYMCFISCLLIGVEKCSGLEKKRFASTKEEPCRKGWGTTVLRSLSVYMLWKYSFCNTKSYFI